MPRGRVTALVLSAAAVLAVVCALIAWQTSDRPVEPSTEGTAETGASEPVEGRGANSRSPAIGTAPSAALSEPAVQASPTGLSAPSDEPSAYAEIRALVHAGRIGAARSRANLYYERFPNGPAGAEIERLTGAHPIRENRP